MKVKTRRKVYKDLNEEQKGFILEIAQNKDFAFQMIDYFKRTRYFEQLSLEKEQTLKSQINSLKEQIKEKEKECILYQKLANQYNENCTKYYNELVEIYKKGCF